jgi:hypothetical protein
MPYCAIFVQVGLLMGCQVRRLGESLVTARVGTDVWLLSRVGSQMSPEVEIQGKPFSTEFTLERLLSCMHKLMPFELRIVQEPFSTVVYRADILPLTVSHHVLPHGGAVLEDLAALMNMTGVDFTPAL